MDNANKAEGIEIIAGEYRDPHFDESEFAEKELIPQLQEIARKCAERGIPLAYLCESRRDETGTKIAVCVNIPGARTSERLRLIGTVLTDEKACARMGILAGIAKMADVLTKGRPAK